NDGNMTAIYAKRGSNPNNPRMNRQDRLPNMPAENALFTSYMNDNDPINVSVALDSNGGGRRNPKVPLCETIRKETTRPPSATSDAQLLYMKRPDGTFEAIGAIPSTVSNGTSPRSGIDRPASPPGKLIPVHRRKDVSSAVSAGVLTTTSLRSVVQANPKKAQIRLNMGYVAPTYDYVQSFWLLPPEWQRDRPAGIEQADNDKQLSAIQLAFVKNRVKMSANKLVSHVKKLKEGCYTGAQDRRSWHAVQREIIENLSRTCIEVPRVHSLYLLDCLDAEQSKLIMRRLGPANFKTADDVELLDTIWSLLDELFRSESAPETESDKLQAAKKGSSEVLPDYLQRLQGLIYSVELETGQTMVESTRTARLYGSLPRVDVQFLRKEFSKDLTFDQLVTRVGEYFKNPLDKESYDVFVRQYKMTTSSLATPDKVGGYSHADLKAVESVDKEPHEPSSGAAATGGNRKSGKKKVKSKFSNADESVKAVSTSCTRCGVVGHAAVSCRNENQDFVKGRCYSCGDKSHRANQCPKDKTKLACERCSLKGHLAEVCRLPWQLISSVKSATGSNAKNGREQPPQPVGEFSTTVGYKAGGGDTSSQPANGQTAAAVQWENCETQSIAKLDLSKGLLYACVKVFSKTSEPVILQGLLDTGASISFVDTKLAHDYVAKGVGMVEKLAKPFACKLAESSVRYVDSVWKCNIEQSIRNGTSGWTAVQFYLMPNIQHPGAIIGRDLFETFGYCVGKLRSCSGSTLCLMEADPYLASLSPEESSTRMVTACVHGTESEVECKAIDKVEYKSYEGRMAKLEWRGEVRPPRSFGPAVKRAQRLEHSLRKKGGQALVDKYTEQFEGWLKSGFIRKVDDSEVRHYLFHHPVVREGHATTPIRPVINGQSLDPFLRETECDLMHITDILTQWRQSDHWVSTDLSKAFLRIQMSVEDQPFLGIYWGGSSYVFCVLPFGLGMSPSWLTANVREVLRRLAAEPEFAGKVLPYMDDLLLIVRDGDQIHTQQRLLVRRCEADGFPIAISKEVWCTQPEHATILGVHWHGGQRDTMGVSFKCPTTTPSTRRELLSVTNALYDPLGLMIEWDMAGRMLMRMASAFDWDTHLPSDLLVKAHEY
ncbi:hypothetical protein FOL47_001704, partial [Perkinsus chesapeaki]